MGALVWLGCDDMGSMWGSGAPRLGSSRGLDAGLGRDIVVGDAAVGAANKKTRCGECSGFE